MKTGELRNRDYSKEHEKRKATKKRMLADINKDKADSFLMALSKQDITFSEWINKQIDKELKEAL